MAARKPTKVLEATGAFKKNPQRKRTDPATTGEIGAAPGYFSTEEAAVWSEIVQNAPVGVLTGSDRLHVEVLSRAIAQLRATEPADIKPALLQQIRAGLSSIGMSPADRSRVNPTWAPEKDNPFRHI